MDLETCWHSRTYCEYAQKDKQCGLAGEGNILMLTLYNMLCIADSILEIVPAVEFPYIILHDPSDKTTEYSGSANFYQQSHSEDKNLTPVAGGKHDILGNSRIIGGMVLYNDCASPFFLEA